MATVRTELVGLVSPEASKFYEISQKVLDKVSSREREFERNNGFFEDI